LEGSWEEGGRRRRREEEEEEGERRRLEREGVEDGGGREGGGWVEKVWRRGNGKGEEWRRGWWSVEVGAWRDEGEGGTKEGGGRKERTNPPQLNSKDALKETQRPFPSPSFSPSTITSPSSTSWRSLPPPRRGRRREERNRGWVEGKEDRGWIMRFLWRRWIGLMTRKRKNIWRTCVSFF
jgi:hypothetical protein